MNDVGRDVGPTSVGDYAAILWRRRRAVLIPLLGVPLVAVALSLAQTPEYTASAQVLIRTENLAAALSGVSDVTSGGDPKRLLDTQSRLARTAEVAESAVDLAGVDMSASDFLEQSAASADPSADILTFSARASSPEVAIELANAYADAFTTYRADLDLGPVQDALATVNARLAKLRGAGSTETPLYSSLLARQQELVSIRSLRTESAVVVEQASEAPRTKPRLAYAGVLGVIVGTLLGVGIALAREALEKRPRSIEELQRRLGLRVLGRIPETPEGATDLVTVSHPHTADAEAYRFLRMYFEQVADDVGGRVFAFVSASEGEGKSTVASNLAVALARAGRDVVLVDCDPLRPAVRQRFGVARAGPGVFEVARGRAQLESALVTVSFDRMAAEAESPVPIRPGEAGEDLLRAGRRQGGPRDDVRSGLEGGEGRLRILPTSPIAVELSDYLVATRLEGLFAQLREEAELVVVDAAPLSTSSGMGVGRLADGLVVVVNVSLVRRPVLDRLTSMLDELAPPTLGLVVTGMTPDSTGPYGYRNYGPAAPVGKETAEGPPVQGIAESRVSSASS